MASRRGSSDAGGESLCVIPPNAFERTGTTEIERESESDRFTIWKHRSAKLQVTPEGLT